MSRKLAIVAALLAAAAFAIVSFRPDEAAAGSVSGRLHLGDSGFSIGATIGDARRFDGHGHEHGRRRHDRWDDDGVGVGIGGAIGGVRWSDGFDDRDRWRRDRRHDRLRDPWRRWPRPVVVLPSTPERVPEQVIVRERVIVQPPPAPVPEAAPPPLDPEGAARTVSAPGAARPREWVLGALLPPALPHVVLDAAAYGLPRPPDGQIYARVDGDVLRIDADSRRIVAVLAE